MAGVEGEINCLKINLLHNNYHYKLFVEKTNKNESYKNVVYSGMLNFIMQ